MVSGKWGVALGVLLAVGCGSSATPDGGSDGSVDLGRDATAHDSGGDMLVLPDLGDDAGPDLGVDLGPDAGDVDLGSDAGDVDLGADLGDVDLGVDMDIDAGDMDIDAGSDMGVVMMDAGPPDLGDDLGPMDAGPPDLGTDAGPPPPPPPTGAWVRSANLVANAPNISFCLGDGAGTFAGQPLEDREIPDFAFNGLPYPAVSAYTRLEDPTLAAGVQLDIGDGAEVSDDCGRLSTIYDGPSTLSLVSGHTYTIVWVGLYDDGTGFPAICGASFTGACPASANAHIVVLDDDVTVPSAANTKTRVVHAIPNLANIDVCWDPDGAGAMTAINVATNLAFAAASPYVTPSPISAGTLMVYAASVGASCATHPGSPIYTVPVPIALLPGALPFNVATLPAGQVDTLFADGWRPGTTSPLVLAAFSDAHI